MRVSPLVKSNISFQRAYTKEELPKQAAARDSALKLLGQTGQSIFIINDSCLPQSHAKNTGVGNLASDDSIEFFKYMKDYIGFNTVQVLPQGQPVIRANSYINYDGSALSLGHHVINPELLATSQFHNILTNEEFKEIVSSNALETKDKFVNFENVILDNSAQDIALKKAFDRFMKLDENLEIKQNFIKYVSENNDWLEPKGIFKELQKLNGGKNVTQWESELDINLYNSDYPQEQRHKRINDLKNQYQEQIKFSNFKDFMADEHLNIAKNKLHEIGLELKGDCLIGFRDFEVWSNPKAFLKDASIGWKLPALNYDEIKNPESPAAKLLKRKVELFAKRYDSIRFDVGWAYIAPKINGFSKELGDDSVMKMIEDSVLKVKGQDYDLKKLIWEFEAGPDDFSPYKDGKLRPEIKNRINVLSQAYISNDWGYLENLLDRGWTKDELLIGVGNHDPICLRQLAECLDPLFFVKPEQIRAQKEAQIPVLARVLNISEDTLRNNPIEFAKAKFALPLTSKNYMTFYMDVFGRRDRFDKQDYHNWEDYRNKVPADYKTAYHNALREGFGFNILDGIAKQMHANGLDKKHESLYNEIIKYRDILLEPEGLESTTTDDTGNSIKNLSKNKWLKPLLIGTGIALAAGAGIYYYITNRRQDLQNETEV